MTAEERDKTYSINSWKRIFRVMEEQETFGVNDVSDVQEQLKMYIQ